MPGQDLNLLSLDGGGIRGLSCLYILQRLMETVNPDKPPKPCDYFDMMAGTSTGGLIAIMLGRLKMDIQQCIDAYREFSNRAFTRKKHIPLNIRGKICERFDSKELENAIKDVLVKQGYSEDELLKEPGASCRVFVCATSDGTSTIVPLRSYSSARGSSELYNTTKIWEAGRATSAASTFFDPISIGPSKQRFFDGATGANNPIRELWKEAKDVWSSAPLENNIGCIVSIGAGVPSMKKFGKDGLEIFQTLKRIATETEATARDFHQEHTDLDDTERYFRFNVPDGLAEVGLEEISESNTIVDGTQYYLAGELAHKQVKKCIKALGEREGLFDYT
ncbi:FabD/lysophospholipase-like protein [Glonium stellatum]|uniref:FabD/lysophospholipase-like protein n=1 Tax=Glonium stellatum TaxID=574774 RepID=A0A8E2EMQ2_9PEZI|nr:FabD/lysophospholipase-like protein [Glonium stellatum]